MSDGGYVELQVASNFSFLRGASHPEELVSEAVRLGHRAVALTDHNSLAGVVRAHQAAREHECRFVLGCRLGLEDRPSLLVYPTDRAAYARLCRLLTRGKRRAEKGDCRLTYADLREHGEGQIVVALPPERCDAGFRAFLDELARDFGDRAYLGAQHLYRGDDAKRLQRLSRLSEQSGLPMVALNDVRYHRPERRRLLDVMTAIREHCTVAAAGLKLLANAERHLKTPTEMARLFRRYPEAIRCTGEIAARCRFSLDELRYEYLDEAADGLTPQQRLERLAAAGVRERYPEGVPDKVAALLRHELALVAELNYAPYFLTVHDIVTFARSRGILCQGRGSAANSAVCYCLGITAVDPARLDLLFERFISAERNEPPDIDVDFEHERREEVIQHVYAKYGRERAGLAATVICYRARGAMREVGKALGLSADVVQRLAETVWGWSEETIDDRRARELGFDPEDRTLRLALELAGELIGFPRHLSQHVGGFVITRGRLDELVPIENAAMPERTVIEWDKDDLDAMGLLKIDVLGLGMLTCIRRAFALIERHHGRRLDLATVPAEDAAVYDMLCNADSVGVFQVESRAQMSMLPRLKPRSFYDLVIEVAIVRPGPIQGDMVHPYLRRRDGKEPVEYPSEALREVLGKTLGVPLFQEQAMRIAMVAAGFSGAEADRLRRAMATFRRTGQIGNFRDKFIGGMIANGYPKDFAERCFQQIQGFGEYGFPESHAASFALLVYVSAWIKCHYPAAFAAALLNSQPMGFYAPAQIVRDARAHGVEVRAVDVNRSDWDATLEHFPPKWTPVRRRKCDQIKEPGACSESIEQEPVPESVENALPALRLGLRQVRGLGEEPAQKLVQNRASGYRSPIELMLRASLGKPVLVRLAEADALRSLGLDRRRALWAVKGLSDDALPLFEGLPPAARQRPEAEVRLPEMRLGEHVVSDYAFLDLSLKSHPMALLRRRFAREGVVRAADLAHRDPESLVDVAGLVLVRQRPGSANGVIFATLEDETGVANIIVWPDTFERFRAELMGATLLLCRGRLQREGIVIHVIAERLWDLSNRLGELRDPEGSRPPYAPTELSVRSRDFH
ncbi:MAG TPA: error-prone DNA polymerase [Stellaceae bacterium]|nr:error-prone DNA polymerase [Stellaceae bacterium]